MTVGPGTVSLGEGMRSGRVTMGLLLGASVSACLDPGRSLDLSDLDAQVILLLARTAGRPLRALSSPLVDREGFGAESALPPVALRTGEFLVVAALDRRALLEAHPFVDLDRLEEIQHLPPSSECALRRGAGGRAEVPLPSRASVLESAEGGWRTFGPTEQDELRAAVGRLSLPITEGPCPARLRAARFGERWSVFADVFVRGSTVSRRLVPADAEPFKVLSAEHLDDDRIVLVTGEGLAVVRRGEQISTWDSPFFFLIDAVPGLPDSDWYFESLGVHPRPPRPGVRRVVVNARPPGSQVSESRLVIFDVTPDAIQHVHTSAMPGRARFLASDGERLLGVAGGEGTPQHELGHYVAVLGENDRFAELRLPAPVRLIAGTGARSSPHAVLTFLGQLQMGDVFRFDQMVDVDVPSGDQRSRRSLAVLPGAPSPELLVGNFGGEVQSFALERPSRTLQLVHAAEVYAAGCVGPRLECGDPGVAGEARHLWATRGPAGPVLAVGSTQCARLLTLDLELGCAALADPPGDPIPPFGSEGIISLRGNTAGTRALVTAEAGLVFELIPADR